MSLALGYSTFRLRPACLRLIHLVQFNYLIDWNDIFFGQKGLKNFKQYGTPYSALLATSAQYTRRYDGYKALCFVHSFKVIGCPLSEKEPMTTFVLLSSQIIFIPFSKSFNQSNHPLHHIHFLIQIIIYYLVVNQHCTQKNANGN